jgi:hypothetical protein
MADLTVDNPLLKEFSEEIAADIVGASPDQTKKFDITLIMAIIQVVIFLFNLFRSKNIEVYDFPAKIRSLNLFQKVILDWRIWLYMKKEADYGTYEKYRELRKSIIQSSFKKIESTPAATLEAMVAEAPTVDAKYFDFNL